MTTHFGMLLVFSALVSMVFAALLRDEPHDQWRTGGRMFGGFVAGGFVAGWLMFGAFG